MKNKKITKIIIMSLVSCIIAGVSALIYFADDIGNYFVHRAFISLTPDTSEWVLETDTYTVVPVITDETVTFYVEDKSGEVVFTCEELWRDWDFKSINIDADSVITAYSADVGEYIYKPDEIGSFYLAEPVCDQ